MPEPKPASLGRCPFGAEAERVSTPAEAPTCPGRRGLLFGLGLAGAAGALAHAPGVARAATAQEQRRATPDLDGTQDRQSFYGPHQAGVVTPQPAAALVASFDVLAGSHDDLVRLMKKLTVRTAQLTAGDMPPPRDPKLPPLDNGVLGPKGFPDNLSMTVGFGASRPSPSATFWHRPASMLANACSWRWRIVVS